jgi:hypothetical protein
VLKETWDMAAPKPTSSCHLTLYYAYNSYTKKGEAIKSYTVHSKWKQKYKIFPFHCGCFDGNEYFHVVRDIYFDVRDIYSDVRDIY